MTRTPDPRIPNPLLHLRRAKRNQQPNRLAKFRSRSHRAVIRVYDDAGYVIETHEHAGDFKKGVDDQDACE